MDGRINSPEGLYRGLFDRFQSLEASHQKLKEQYEAVLQERASNGSTSEEKEVTSDPEDVTSLPGWGNIPGAYCLRNPHRNVLDYMGHAVHVSRIDSWEIIYWNRAAEKLFGYKDYEVIGQRATEILFDEEHHHSAVAIMQRLINGRCWAGQLPLKKRSGECFMALVTKNPVYEDGELAGIVTVSSDAAVFNNTYVGNMRTNGDNAYDQSKSGKMNFAKIQWHSRPQIAAEPHLASSVSNLASKVLLRTRGVRECEETEVESHDAKADRPPRVPISKPSFSFSIRRGRTEAMSLDKEESAPDFSQSSKPVVKNFQKFQIGAINNLEKVVDENSQRNGSGDNSIRNEAANVAYSPRDPMEITSHICNLDVSNHLEFVGNSEIRWEDLQIREEIGQGSFAVVYRGIWNASDVAVKVYSGNRYSEETLLDSKNEIDIMRRLRHPNVLLYMGAVFSEERIAMVTEYMTRGSLFKALHKCNQPLDMRRRLRMAIDVARGVNYLHRRNPPIVHRDLKSSNLLVDKSWNVKVGDFGLSKLKYATFLTERSGRGTPQWMAPEVLRNERSTEKSDVFSFGVILWELMTECIPWSDLNPLQVVGVVGFMDRRLDIPHNIDPQISSIISECWQSNPEDRPSFENIIHKMTKIVNASAGATSRTTSTN